MPGSTALSQARESGAFTADHDAFWALGRAAFGDAGGTRALVEVLLLHRHMAHADVIAGLRAAVQLGAASADVVAVEARKAAATRIDDGERLSSAEHTRKVVSLTARRLVNPETVIAGLPPDRRPAPSISAYDELLTRRTRPPEATPPASSSGASS